MSPQDAKLDLLKSIPLFSGFGRRELERVGMLTDQIDLPAGRVLMRQGEAGHEMYVIVRGRAEVNRDGRVIAERVDGDVVGEIALLDEGPRTATITLTEPSQLLVVGHRDFHMLMDEMPTVRTQLLESLARRVRQFEPDAAH
ncbi:MAG: cyclic nucleotide-binding domain-containing protein [Candidatus Limnocylindria bacterium]